MKSEEALQLGYNFHIWLLDSVFVFCKKKLRWKEVLQFRQQVVDLELSLVLSELTKSETECKTIKNVYEFGKKSSGLQEENSIFSMYWTISWCLLPILIACVTGVFISRKTFQ